MLEHVLTALEQRAADVERLGHAFSSSVGDQLRIAEARARDIGAILAQSSTDATAALGAHHDAIRNASAEERERTAAILTAAYEQATGEMASLFGNANERFARLVEDMRTMSAAIRQELDVTRAELSRAAVELPRDTQDTTAAMRRVVSDQIKALGEIARSSPVRAAWSKCRRNRPRPPPRAWKHRARLRRSRWLRPARQCRRARLSPLPRHPARWSHRLPRHRFRRLR